MPRLLGEGLIAPATCAWLPGLAECFGPPLCDITSVLVLSLRTAPPVTLD